MNDFNPTTIEQVAEFHKSFGHPVETYPVINDKDRNDLRVKLLQEELNELEDALREGTEEQVLDALVDLQYVLDGAFLALGFARYKNRAFHEVHRSNMNKLGPDGKPIFRADGKILKPEGWQPPNLKAVIAILS